MNNQKTNFKPKVSNGRTVQNLRENIELPLEAAFKRKDRKKLSESIAENANYAENADIANAIIETNCSMSVEPPKLDQNRIDLEETPIIPAEIYDGIPKYLFDLTSNVKNARERDVMLVSAITILSNVFPKVSGYYDNRKVHSNLYSFIVAPPASGKGVMGHACHLCKQVHKNLVSGKFHTGSMNLVSNETKRYMVPEDVSSRAMVDYLEQNPQGLLLFSTESDTISKNNKDWGNWTDILRKAYHHESYSLGRKQDSTTIELEFPRLSVCLTGTPSQVDRLMPDVENGLFSRFVFYTFDDIQKFELKNSKDSFSFYNVLEEKSKEFTSIYRYFNQKDIVFNWSDHQFEKVNLFFQKLQDNYKGATFTNINSVIFRHGLICYRISMILTMLKAFEEKTKDETIVCSDEILCISLHLTSILFQHAVSVLNRHKSSAGIVDSKYGRLIERFNVGEEITNKMMLSAGKLISIKERTVFDYIKVLQKCCRLEKVKHGIYKKLS
jgi:hypothetical protein